MKKLNVVLGGLCAIAIISVPVVLFLSPGAVAAADVLKPVAAIHLAGNEQGQAVLVHIDPWGQVVVTLYDEWGRSVFTKYAPLQVDEKTTNVMVDVCGSNVYLVESGESVMYHHIEIPGAEFSCRDEYTLWIPIVVK